MDTQGMSTNVNCMRYRHTRNVNQCKLHVIWTHKECQQMLIVCDMDTQGMSTSVNCMRYGHTRSVN